MIVGGRVLVKNRDRVDTLERQQDFGPLALRRNRPLRPFVGTHRSIRIQTDDQRVAKLPRILQIPNVAWMKQIEDPVGEDDFAAPRVNGQGNARRFVDRICGV